jgi:hypothetical protein
MVCERRGEIWLTNVDGETLGVRTHCKTWSCLACAPAVMSSVLMRIEYGCLIAEHSFFITLTYRNTRPEDIRDAQCVRRDLRVFWSKIRKELGKVEWFQIVELTKKGQPHMHMVWSLQETMEISTLKCLVKRIWREVTRDSFIVDVQLVMGAAGAAGYLAKYLLKGVMHREELEALGFKRRWTRSRGWPSPEPLQLWGTEKERWKDRQWSATETTLPEEVAGHIDLVRVGDNLALKLGDKKRKKGLENMYRGLLE